MTTSYKILIDDRNYTEWCLYDALSLIEVEKLHIIPTLSKLFSSDIFDIKDKNVNILHSSVRSMPSIPGILVLKGNKTYGKYKDKFLYKCIPDDRRFPEFTVPYNVKLGFSKNTDNKYIVFKYNNWDNKHPQGTIVSVLGDVDILSNFYEYQLYCKSLYASIQEFNKAVSNKLKKKTAPEFISSMIEKYDITDRTNEQVYSIDSKETSDYDDAFSITELGNNAYKISIYISNVPLWMEELDLWESFSQRISTIYLPDRKRPMMPLTLSNCVCSLCEKEDRLAFCIDLTIKDNEIIGYCLENTYINVYKNHVYDSKELLKDKNYKLMLDVVDKLSKDYKYLKKIKVIPHHWDPRFATTQTESPKLCFGYMGSIKSLPRYPNFLYFQYFGGKYPIEFFDTEIGRSVTDKIQSEINYPIIFSENNIPKKVLFNCDISLRPKDSQVYRFKTTAKIATAAALGHNIITTDDWAVQDILPDDYPFLIKDISKENIDKMFQTIIDDYQGEGILWKKALKMMEDVREKLSIEKVVLLYTDLIKEFS